MPAWKKVIVSGSNPVFNHITASGAISSSGIITGASLTMGTIPALSNAGLVVVPAQSNITRLGTLTDLTVDSVTINNDTITTTAGNLVIHPSEGRQLQLGTEEGAYDVQFYSSVEGVDMLWDESAGILDVNAKLVVDSSDVSLDSTSTLNIDNSNTSNGITIGTATSGVPVQIGHTTSLTTVNDKLIITGNVTASGAISGSGVIIGNAGANAGYTVRPNLYFFATNTSAITLNGGSDFGAGTTDNQGALPATNTTTVTLSQEQNSHTSIFSLSSNRITIARAGLYKITYNALLEINNGSNRVEGFVGLVQETSGGTVTLVDGTEGRGYHRFVHSTRPSAQTYGASVIVNVAADSIYDLRFGMTKQTLASQKLRTMPTGTSFMIEAVT